MAAGCAATGAAPLEGRQAAEIRARRGIGTREPSCALGASRGVPRSRSSSLIAFHVEGMKAQSPTTLMRTRVPYRLEDEPRRDDDWDSSPPG
jgi:hypothetical protein